VSIFLSIFDVHINRAPAGGEVRAVRYRQGAFRAAFRKDAAERNERSELEMSTERGTIRIRQIAGVVARRIVCRVRAGDRLASGERFGLIRFGSRTDLLLPAGVTLSVRRGDRVRGGLSVIGTWE
jgi:phosphatidylserine decarboxylase